MRSILFCLLILTTEIWGQPFSDILDQVREDHEIVGLAVAVSCQGELLETYHSGLSNIDLQIPVSPQTKFRVASISKSFTAAGLMKLLDEESISLDNDISSVIGYEVRNPSFPDVPITFRMLLSHTSSLQDGSGYGPFLSATYSADPIPDMTEVLLPGGQYFTSNMWRTEEPGTYFAYSNINYGLIGTLVEAISGQRFDVYMKNQILEPMGITGSYNVLDLNDLNELSVLYRDAIAQADDYGGNYPQPWVDENYVPGTNGSLFAPQGGLRCSLTELMTFAHMLLNEGVHEGLEILSPESVEAMLSEQWQYDGTNGDDYFGLFRNWGLGIHRAEGTVGFDKVFTNVLMLGHPGEAYGLISDLYLDPESKLALAFISNGYYSGGGYAFADNSIFYAPEEEVFEAIEATFQGPCITLNTENIGNTAPCFNLNSGYLSAGTGSLIRITDLGGRNAGSSLNEFDLSQLQKGIYLVEVSSDKGSCMNKIAVF